MIPYKDFNNWKTDSVTEAFFTSIVERIEDAKQTLSYSAGVDKDYDNYLRGFIAGQRDMLEVQLQTDEEQ